MKAKTTKIIARGVIFVSLLGLLSSCVARQQSLKRDRIYLWPEQAPWAKGTDEKDRPSLMSFPAKGRNTGCAVIICPGGGYSGVAIEKEGTPTAQWLNGLGVSAFTLDYRHNGKGYQHPAPLSDAQRAIRLVRYRAKEWAIDPNRIGIIYGPYSGGLANDGEQLELSKPGDTDEFGDRQYIRVERVGYSDGSHPGEDSVEPDLWPIDADGGRKSLGRKNTALYGNDPNNWQAITPTPGT
ncbi:MAG: hypothetical protein FJ263_06700 [Planctomycetes bacterium]|nr:hypothetical protein [Planctomycetota bacterium]